MQVPARCNFFRTFLRFQSAFGFRSVVVVVVVILGKLFGNLFPIKYAVTAAETNVQFVLGWSVLSSCFVFKL